MASHDGDSYHMESEAGDDGWKLKLPPVIIDEDEWKLKGFRPDMKQFVSHYCQKCYGEFPTPNGLLNVGTIKTNEKVVGLAIVGNLLYALIEKTDLVKVYSLTTPFRYKGMFKIPGVTDPIDMAASELHTSVYVTSHERISKAYVRLLDVRPGRLLEKIEALKLKKAKYNRDLDSLKMPEPETTCQELEGIIGKVSVGVMMDTERVYTWQMYDLNRYLLIFDAEELTMQHKLFLPECVHLIYHLLPKKDYIILAYQSDDNGVNRNYVAELGIPEDVISSIESGFDTLSIASFFALNKGADLGLNWNSMKIFFAETKKVNKAEMLLNKYKGWDLFSMKPEELPLGIDKGKNNTNNANIKFDHDDAYTVVGSDSEPEYVLPLCYNSIDTFKTASDATIRSVDENNKPISCRYDTHIKLELPDLIDNIDFDTKTKRIATDDAILALQSLEVTAEYIEELLEQKLAKFRQRLSKVRVNSKFGSHESLNPDRIKSRRMSKVASSKWSSSKKSAAKANQQKQEGKSKPDDVSQPISVANSDSNVTSIVLPVHASSAVVVGVADEFGQQQQQQQQQQSDDDNDSSQVTFDNTPIVQEDVKHFHVVKKSNQYSINKGTDVANDYMNLVFNVDEDPEVVEHNSVTTTTHSAPSSQLRSNILSSHEYVGSTIGYARVQPRCNCDAHSFRDYADSNNSEISLEFKRYFEAASADFNVLNYPVHMCFDEAKNLFIADIYNDRVLSIKKDLNEYRVLLERNVFGLRKPTRIAYHAAKKRIIVAHAAESTEYMLAPTYVLNKPIVDPITPVYENQITIYQYGTERLDFNTDSVGKIIPKNTKYLEQLRQLDISISKLWLK